MSSQNALKGVLLSLASLILLTSASAAAFTLRPHQPPSAVVPSVCAITNGTAERFLERSLEMQTSGTAGSVYRSSRGVRSARFWLPDTLETSWTAPDKKLHFLACYSVVLTGRVTSGETAPGVVEAVALSVGKELWDLWFKVPSSRRGISKRDLVADVLGIGAAVLMVEWFGK